MISSHTHWRRREREKNDAKKRVERKTWQNFGRDERFWVRRALLLFLRANERTNDRTSSDNKSFSLSLSLDFISKKKTRVCSFFVRACLWDRWRSRYFLVFFQSKTFLLFLFKKAVKKHQERERETLLFKNLLYYKSNPRKNATEEEEEEEEEEEL